MRELEGRKAGLKKVEKLLEKYLTKARGCDIIVESPKSEELRGRQPVIEN